MFGSYASHVIVETPHKYAPSSQGATRSLLPVPNLLSADWIQTIVWLRRPRRVQVWLLAMSRHAAQSNQKHVTAFQLGDVGGLK